MDEPGWVDVGIKRDRRIDKVGGWIERRKGRWTDE
jgi:hypothetical protein